jgi:hypothetical protein
MDMAALVVEHGGALNSKIRQGTAVVYWLLIRRRSEQVFDEVLSNHNIQPLTSTFSTNLSLSPTISPSFTSRSKNPLMS